MKTLLSLIALFPALAFAGPLVLELNIKSGSVLKIREPVQVKFVASSALPSCNDHGSNPMPHYSPKVKYLNAKVSKSGKSVRIEAATELQDAGLCRFQFDSVSVEYSDLYSVKVEAVNKANSRIYDVSKLEVIANANSAYQVDCKDMSCAVNRDGVLTGRAFSNQGVLLLDLGKARRSSETRVNVTASFK